MVERDRLEERRTPGRPPGRASTQVRSIPGASRGGSARRAPGRGCRAAPPRSCRCGSGRRSRAGRPGRRSAPPCRCGTARRRRSAATPPRRGAGPRRCGGRRGTGSRARARSRPAPTPGPRRGSVCSSRSVSKTRCPPKRLRSPRVTPYTPPLTATSSPKTSSSGRRSISSASVALIDWARVSAGRVRRRLVPVEQGATRPAGARWQAPAAPSPRRGWPGGARPGRARPRAMTWARTSSYHSRISSGVACPRRAGSAPWRAAGPSRGPRRSRAGSGRRPRRPSRHDP